MRKKGKNNVNFAGQNRSALDKIMISPPVSKVKPSHPAAFAGLRDCSTVEVVPVVVDTVTAMIRQLRNATILASMSGGGER